MPKNRIVLVEFPYSDEAECKVRPALLLTGPRGEYQEVVVAFISTAIPGSPETTDILLERSDPDFKKTGLTQPSVLRLHKLATQHGSSVKRELGYLTPRILLSVEECLRKLFALKQPPNAEQSTSPKK